MFLLNNKMILNYMDQRILEIQNFEKGLLHPTYYYFRLGKFFKILDPQTGEYKIIELGEPGQEIAIIPPRGYALIQSLERFKCTEKVFGIFGQISALARKGLRLNHSPTIDPHFDGYIEMGLENLLNKPRELRYGESIAKVLFFNITDTYPIADIKGTISEKDYERRRDLHGAEPL